MVTSMGDTPVLRRRDPAERRRVILGVLLGLPLLVALLWLVLQAI